MLRMTDTSSPAQLRDRLSTNPKSPYYDEALLARGVGIKFDGQEKTSVEKILAAPPPTLHRSV
jgi:hypothetical protein